MCVLDAMPFHGMHRGQRTTFRSHFSPPTWVLGSRGLEAKSFLWPWVLLSAASNTSLKYSMADSESFKKSYFPYQKEHRKFYRCRREVFSSRASLLSCLPLLLCLCSPVHASTGYSLYIRMASWCLFCWEGWTSLSRSGCLAGLVSYLDEIT